MASCSGAQTLSCRRRARARALGAAGVVFEEETGGAAAAYEALLGAAGDLSLERAAHGAPALAHVPAACARVLRGVHALLDGSAEATAGARAKPAVRGAPDGWKVIF